MNFFLEKEGDCGDLEGALPASGTRRRFIQVSKGKGFSKHFVLELGSVWSRDGRCPSCVSPWGWPDRAYAEDGWSLAGRVRLASSKHPGLGDPQATGGVSSLSPPPCWAVGMKTGE